MAKKRHHHDMQSPHVDGERKSSPGYYEGLHNRRRQEMEDAGMIREDHNAVANLPQEVMMKEYPKTGPYMPEYLDDTIRGIDWQMDEDDRKRTDTFNPHKY